MCTASAMKMLGQDPPKAAAVDPDKPQPIRNATDVPLGDGLVDAAKTSILNRRERIRRAVEGE